MSELLEDKTTYTAKQTKAFGFYMRQWMPKEIGKEVGVSERAVQLWINKFNWKEHRDDMPVELALHRRIKELLHLDEKTEQQLRELDTLLKHELGEIKNRNAKAKDGSNRGRTTNKTKNDISKITAEQLSEFREKTFFFYQLNIWAEKQNPDINWMRFYLKSRQIGLTYYFAFEAFEDAVLTGDNQVFLSASKRQSEIFKKYILLFAAKIGEVELKGKDEITLSNGATFYFLSTNSRTAQGYHGHLYIDEVFWIPNFKMLDDLAGGMAMHSKWRTTYLSTPSSIAHEAYPKWQGDKKHKIDLSHTALKNGALGPDRIYRKIITVDDAIQGGATFFDMERLKFKYPDKEVFNNLLRCKFLDDNGAAFGLKKLMACKVDANLWSDVDFEAARPVGNAQVWIGYDPSGDGDEAAVVVALPPKTTNGAFRLVEKIRLEGASYTSQAQSIRELTDKYNVAEIAMDTTGIGGPTAELVEVFFPRLTRITYSVNTKVNMVYKAREVIGAGRLLFDGAWDDVIHAFMLVKRSVTPRSGQMTFTAKRTKASSHGDIASAIMHLLFLEGTDPAKEVTPTVSFGD